MDFTQLWEAGKAQLASALAMAGVVAYFMWRERGKQKLDDADSDGSVRAIGEWQAIARDLRDVNRELTLRADAFAKERNELIGSLAAMSAQVSTLQATIERQAQHIQQLSGEVQQLRAGR